MADQVPRRREGTGRLLPESVRHRMDKSSSRLPSPTWWAGKIAQRHHLQTGAGHRHHVPYLRSWRQCLHTLASAHTHSAQDGHFFLPSARSLSSCPALLGFW